MATSNADGRTRALLVGGGIANFTDVAATFKGIIQVDFGPSCELPNGCQYQRVPLLQETLSLERRKNHKAVLCSSMYVSLTSKGTCRDDLGTCVQAMKEKAEAIKAANMRIFVRRGGPNYQAGLALMRQMGQDTGIPVEVFGPETSMTVICAKAIEYVKGGKI